LPENPVVIEPRFCHFAGNSFPLLKVNLVSRNSTPVSRNSRNHLEAYGGCATRCSKNPSFFMLNPVINTMREFWGDCGIFTPPEYFSVSFSRGKQQIQLGTRLAFNFGNMRWPWMWLLQNCVPEKGS